MVSWVCGPVTVPRVRHAASTFAPNKNQVIEPIETTARHGFGCHETERRNVVIPGSLPSTTSAVLSERRSRLLKTERLFPCQLLQTRLLARQVRLRTPRKITAPQTKAAIIDWAAIPSWAVKAIAERIYAPNPCGEGRYLDPQTDACVYMCREGYRFDAETRSCVRAGLPKCKDGYVLKDNACVRDTECDGGYAYDAVKDACVLPQGAQEGQRSFFQRLVAGLARSLLSGNDACPVGFYHDPKSKACVPVCAPGYIYDRTLKRCVPSAGGPLTF
eukprot:TRINITY_DN302_c0_g1_i1.p1 TRINITY_DN302_c0_g1~~TRINITY_DN302_c0_g1_i1.p1  ORF type:complete len:274 (-),score=0.87 TRINITY_DN302_c0_g1_i1:551-1372(-)